MKRAFDLTPDVPQVGRVIPDRFNLQRIEFRHADLRKHATRIGFKPLPVSNKQFEESRSCRARSEIGAFARDLKFQ